MTSRNSLYYFPLDTDYKSYGRNSTFELSAKDDDGFVPAHFTFGAKATGNIDVSTIFKSDFTVDFWSKVISTSGNGIVNFYYLWMTGLNSHYYFISLMAIHNTMLSMDIQLLLITTGITLQLSEMERMSRHIWMEQKYSLLRQQTLCLMRHNIFRWTAGQSMIHRLDLLVPHLLRLMSSISRTVLSGLRTLFRRHRQTA